MSRAGVWIRRAPRYVVPAFAVLVLLFGGMDLGPAWNAAHGGGKAGTFTVRERSCGRRLCAWRGEFISDDGVVVRNDVRMRDPQPEDREVGDNVRARDTGDFEGVFAETGSQTWRAPALLIAGSAGMLAIWVAWLAVMARRRRMTLAGA